MIPFNFTMGKSAKRSAEQAFEEGASPSSNREKKSKKSKKAKRDSAAEQLQSENQRAHPDVEEGISQERVGKAAAETSSTTLAESTASQSQLSAKLRRKERRKQKKRADADTSGSPESGIEANQRKLSSTTTKNSHKKRKNAQKEHLKEAEPNGTAEPTAKKKKKNKQRSRAKQRQREEAGDDADLPEADTVVGTSDPVNDDAAPATKQEVDIPREGLEDGLSDEDAPSKKKRQRLKKRHETPSAWSLATSAGCVFIEHDSILTPDDEHLLLPTRFDVRVYARSTSLLIRRLQPRLNSSEEQVISCTLSKSTPSRLLIATSLGSVSLWDWSSGDRIARWKSKGNVSQVISLASSGKSEQVLTLSHTSGTKDSIIAARTLEISSKRQIIGSELLKRADLDSNVYFSEDTNIIVATARNRLLIGWRSTKKSGELFDWRELHVPGGIASFDVRSFIERRAVSTPHVDVAVGVRSGEIMLYEDLLYKMIGREKNNQALDISARILHWHRHSVNTVKWSRDGHYLISGGRETVLVIWQLDTNHQQFLPHLSSEIMSLSISPRGSSYSVRLADNSVMVLSSANLDVATNIAGLASSFHPQAALTASLHPSSPDRLLLATPKNSNRFNFPTFQLQTYDLHTDRELARQALTRNATTVVSTTSEDRHIEPNVMHLTLSSDGKWLATIEEWVPDPSDLDGVTLVTENDTDDFGTEACLKIWLYNESHGDWELVNRIDSPHSTGSCRILALESNPTRNEFVTAGQDGKLRMWRPKARIRDGVAVKNTKGEQLYNWSKASMMPCITNTNEKSETATIAYSPDGSVIAASWSLPAKSTSPRWTHLIDPEKAAQCATIPGLLTHGTASIALSGRYLVCLSNEICIFDTVSDTTMYRAPLDSAYQGFKNTRFLAANTLDGTVAIAVNKLDGKGGQIAVINPAALKGNANTQALLFETSTSVHVKALLSSPSMQGYVVVDSNASISRLKRTGLSSINSVHDSSTIPQQEPEELRRGLDRIFGRPSLTTTPPFADTNTTLNGVSDSTVSHDASASALMTAPSDVNTNTKSLDQIVHFQSTAGVPGVRELFSRVAGWFAGGRGDV